MAKRFFKQKDMKPIIDAYGLAKTFRGQSIYERLQGTSAIYFAHKDLYDSIEPNQDVREQLEAVTKSVDRLTTQMEKLSPAAKISLTRTISHFEHLALISSIRDEEEPVHPAQWLPLEHGVSTLKIYLGEGAYMNFSYDEKEIARALKTLKIYFEIARSELRQRSPGRRPSIGLRMWVINIRSIWRDYRGEPFRITYPRGEPKSPAARFCVEALQLIDPEIPKSRVVTAMRAYVSEVNKKSQEMGVKKS